MLASEAGVQSDAFWSLTPWQLARQLEGYQGRVSWIIWSTWHNALFQRLKKLPPYSRFDTKKKKPDDLNKRIKHAFRSLPNPMIKDSKNG